MKKEKKLAYNIQAIQCHEKKFDIFLTPKVCILSSKVDTTGNKVSLQDNLNQPLFISKCELILLKYSLQKTFITFCRGFSNMSSEP